MPSYQHRYHIVSVINIDSRSTSNKKTLANSLVTKYTEHFLEYQTRYCCEHLYDSILQSFIWIPPRVEGEVDEKSNRTASYRGSLLHKTNSVTSCFTLETFIILHPCNTSIHFSTVHLNWCKTITKSYEFTLNAVFPKFTS